MTQTVDPWSNDGFRSASKSTGIAMITDGAVAAPDRHVAGRLAWTGMQSSCRSPAGSRILLPFCLLT